MWSGPHSENQLKIQSHFYRVHACFVKYFLMTEKLQQIRKLLVFFKFSDHVRFDCIKGKRKSTSSTAVH